MGGFFRETRVLGRSIHPEEGRLSFFLDKGNPFFLGRRRTRESKEEGVKERK